MSKWVRKDGVFLGLAGLLLGISLGLCPQEIPRSRLASPWKTLSLPPLLLRLTHSSWCNKLIVMLGIKLGVNLEVKLGVGSKTGSKIFVLAFLKCMDGSVLAFLKCTDGSILIFLKYMDGSVLAHLRFPMQYAPTIFPQSGNSKVP